MKYLQDGETKITSKRGARIIVEAERVDSETPYISLKRPHSASFPTEITSLTDVDAADLIVALQKCSAFSLPASEQDRVA